MKRYKRLGLAGFLVAAMLALASCGDGAGQGTDQNTGEVSTPPGTQEGTQESRGSAQRMETTGGMAGMQGMDHDSMGTGSEGTARQMLSRNGEYSDEYFIDMMAPHHRGAVEMAEIAVENAEHPEIEAFGQDIITTQAAEIEELQSIKREEYGTSDTPMEMSGEEMGMMLDPKELAGQEPFDQAFIDAMIPHHESAIAMAEVALEESDNPRIRELAEQIAVSQRREIEQMREWRREWYPEG